MLRVHITAAGPQGSPWFQTLHFTGSVQGDADAATTATKAFLTAIASYVANTVGMQVEPAVQVVDAATGDVTAVLTSPQTSVAGTGSTDILPKATQLVCNLHTGQFVAGREIRGKIQVPGLTETQNDSNGNVVATTATAFNTALGNLRTGAAHDLMVYSRTHGVAYPVASAAASRTWGVLRSRRD